MVGVYITEHPLDKIKEEMDRAKVTYSSQLNDSYHDKNVTMAGVVIGVRPHTTRTGKPMAFAEVEDMTGTISVVVWPRTWEETRDLWEEDKIIFMQGRVDAENREPKLLCESATTQVAILDVADEESIYEEPEPTNGFYQEAPPEDDIYETWENGDNGSADDEIASIDGAVHIRIHLERSDNNDRDARALSHIHGMLYERSGSDTFSIVLHSDGRSVEVNFKEKTCYDEVAHELQKTVHPEMIEIIPLDDEKESG